MPGFVGSDEALEREIGTLERIGRLRVRKASESLAELARDLAELRRERARRRAASALPGRADAPEAVEERSTG